MKTINNIQSVLLNKNDLSRFVNIQENGGGAGSKGDLTEVADTQDNNDENGGGAGSKGNLTEMADIQDNSDEDGGGAGSKGNLLEITD